jgi:choice-of-anchor B domain-containing protein
MKISRHVSLPWVLVAAAALLLALVPGSVPRADAAAVGSAICKGGKAAGYPCKGMDLQSYVPSADLAGARIADVWGWADPKTKKEYALLGSTKGLLFVDVSNPKAPVYLGSLAGKAEPALIWQEIEIFKNHAFVVCDLSPCNLQIFDLTRLRGAEEAQTWTPDSVFPVPNAHSIAQNPETGHLFVNGSLAIGNGSPVILDINDPKTPVPVGAITDDGYTHDSLCRTYHGPDKSFEGNEICFNFNEDTINVYDVQNPATPVQLAKVTYENASYVHSGALTKDQSYLISTDEGDETDHGLRSTLYIWDVRKLSDPKLIGTYVAKSGAIDHNVYADAGDALFHANYTNGFRILDMSQASKGKLREVAYFDIMPESDAPDFDGSWAAYPYLPSGNMLIGGMGQGLFIVKPDPSILKRLR